MKRRFLIGMLATLPLSQTLLARAAAQVHMYNAMANTAHLWLSDEGDVVVLPSQTLDNANCLSDPARADRYFRSSLGNR